MNWLKILSNFQLFFFVGIENSAVLCFYVSIMNKQAPTHELLYTTTIRKLFRIERKAIGYFRFILEGYDGIAILETLDAKAGIIALHIAPGCESVVDAMITDLSGDHLVEPLDDMPPYVAG